MIKKDKFKLTKEKIIYNNKSYSVYIKNNKKYIKVLNKKTNKFKFISPIKNKYKNKGGTPSLAELLVNLPDHISEIIIKKSLEYGIDIDKIINNIISIKSTNESKDDIFSFKSFLLFDINFNNKSDIIIIKKNDNYLKCHLLLKNNKLSINYIYPVEIVVNIIKEKKTNVKLHIKIPKNFNYLKNIEWEIISDDYIYYNQKGNFTVKNEEDKGYLLNLTDIIITHYKNSENSKNIYNIYNDYYNGLIFLYFSIIFINKLDPNLLFNSFLNELNIKLSLMLENLIE